MLGAKWTVALRFGSSIPQWDQWDAEGLHLFLPWTEGRLTFAELFLPHNEHRVVLTKLLSLGLVELNGQWDALLECTVNAVLHSALAAGLFVLGRRHFPGRAQAGLFILVAAFFALPLAWQNNLGGFHSQQYFLLGLSCAAICAATYARPWSAPWWLGFACTALAMLSMGSGFLAASAILVVVALRGWRGAIRPAEAWPTLALCIAFNLVGWFTRVVAGNHEPLKAHSVQDFLGSAVQSLQWPAQWSALLGLLVWLPWIVLFWRCLKGPHGPARAEGTMLALGGWVLLQILATAVVRGAGGAGPASRYLDTLGFGAVVNGIILALLLGPALAARGRLLLPALAATVWTLVVAQGVYAEARHSLGDLPAIRTYLSHAEEHVRDYLATGDAANFDVGDIPYPGKNDLIERLSHQSLRAILPPVVRPPLPIKAATGPRGFTVSDALPRYQPGDKGPMPLGRRYWSTFGRPRNAGAAEWESEPFALRSPALLQFRVAGATAGPGVALEVRDARTDLIFRPVALGTESGESWRTTYVQLPPGNYYLSARDNDPQAWLAFTQPVEIGRLSYWTPRLLRQGPVLMLAAVGLALLALILGDRGAGAFAAAAAEGAKGSAPA